MPTVNASQVPGAIAFVSPNDIAGSVVVEATAAAGVLTISAAQVGTPPTVYARANLVPSTDWANLDAD